MVEHRPPKPGVVGSSPTSPAFFEIVKIDKGIMFKSIGNYFSGVKKEVKKVSWLSKKEILGSTVIVFIFAMPPWKPLRWRVFLIWGLLRVINMVLVTFA